MLLRDYEQDLVEQVARLLPSKCVLLQLATGGGKTVIAAELIRREVEAGGLVLFVGHRHEILDQAITRLRDVGITPNELRASTKKYSTNSQVLVASSQTLANRVPPKATLVVLDEGHVHYAANVKLLAKLPRAKVLVLTATPCRLDGAPLYSLADVIVRGPAPRILIDAGWLVPCEIWGAPTPELHGIPIRAGEFAPEDLEKRYLDISLVGAIPDTWLRLAAGKRTILFASGVTHSQAVCSELKARGIRAAHLDGNTPLLERRQLFAKLAMHKLDVLCNVGIALEGLDIPVVDCIYWARATTSLALFLQGTGRGMRPATGKDRLLVIDGGGNTWRHGFPDKDRLWDLSGHIRNSGETVNMRECEECGHIWSVTALGPICAACGHTNVSKRCPPKIVTAKLTPLSIPTILRMRKEELALQHEYSLNLPARPAPEWALGHADGAAEAIWLHYETARVHGCATVTQVEACTRVFIKLYGDKIRWGYTGGVKVHGFYIGSYTPSARKRWIGLCTHANGHWADADIGIQSEAPSATFPIRRPMSWEAGLPGPEPLAHMCARCCSALLTELEKELGYIAANDACYAYDNGKLARAVIQGMVAFPGVVLP